MTALSYSSVLVIEVKPGCEMQMVCVKATVQTDTKDILDRIHFVDLHEIFCSQNLA